MHGPARWESYKRWQANKCVFIQATKMFYLLPSPMTLPFKDTSLLCLRSFWKTTAKKGKKSWVYLTMRWLFWSSIFIKPIRENDKQNLHVTEVFLKNIKSLVKGKRSIMLFTRSLSNLYNLQYFNINDTSFFNSSLSFHASRLLHTLSVLSLCQLAVLFPKYTLFVPSGKNAPHFEMDFARGCSPSRVKENGFYWRSFGGLIYCPQAGPHLD